MISLNMGGNTIFFCKSGRLRIKIWKRSTWTLKGSKFDHILGAFKHLMVGYKTLFTHHKTKKKAAYSKYCMPIDIKIEILLSSSKHPVLIRMVTVVL